MPPGVSGRFIYFDRGLLADALRSRNGCPRRVTPAFHPDAIRHCPARAEPSPGEREPDIGRYHRQNRKHTVPVRSACAGRPSACSLSTITLKPRPPAPFLNLRLKRWGWALASIQKLRDALLEKRLLTNTGLRNRQYLEDTLRL